jgi:hypothetical protein
MDYLAFIDIYHDRISAGRGFSNWAAGACSGYGRTVQDVSAHSGMVRSISKDLFKLTQYGFDGWAVLEWECCHKHPNRAQLKARPSLHSIIIRGTERAFDDFAGGKSDPAALRKMMGF